MKYLVIARFHSFLIYVSNTTLGSSMFFPLHQAFTKWSELGSCHGLPYLKKKHGILDVYVNMKTNPICYPYYQYFATPYRDHISQVLSFCYFLVALSDICFWKSILVRGSGYYMLPSK
jgi:hypothetical protein